MMSKLMDLRFALVACLALLISACSGKEEPTPTVTEDTTTTEEVDQGDTRSAEEILQEEMLAKWGSEDQSGLDYYAGSDRVFFDFDSSELSADARATLAKQADWLMHYTGVDVSIEGHCDERGTREYNLALGERRAVAVRDYLVALGVPGRRLGTISYGKERPQVVGQGETYWSQNRRGVLVVQ